MNIYFWLNRGPHFELMASARLNLEDANDSIHTHDLVTVNHENKSHQLPLFGHFCCRLAVQPNCISQVAINFVHFAPS